MLSDKGKVICAEGLHDEDKKLYHYTEKNTT